MTLEQLKAMLEAGTITQEQYDELVEKLGLKEPEPEPKPESDPDLETIIQRAVDRATNKLGNDNKKLREQLEKLKKSKLSDDERAELERQQKEEMLAEREKALKDKENRLYALKAIKKAGLDDGSDTALELLDFVVGDDETEIDTRVKAFQTLVNRMVKDEVDRKFKEGGRDPGRGGGGEHGDNPWSKETFNLSRQMEIELKDPELAKRMQAEAK